MSKEMENKNEVLEGEVMDKTPEVPEEPKEAPKDEPKKEESEQKEFFLIRGAKAIGHGIGSAGRAVGGFIKKHPYISTATGTALGFAAKMGLDYLMDNHSEANPVETSEEEQAILPEPEEPDYEEYEEPEIESEPETEPTMSEE